MKKITVYLLFLALFLNMECQCEEETLVQGLETRVNGNIFDELNQLPVASQKLYIGEYEDHFALDGGHREYLIQNLDSTYTDENGNYDMVFTTSGQGSLYKIMPEQTSSIWTYFQEPIRVENIESDNEINFDFMNLFPCTLNITLNSIEHLPIIIHSPVAVTSGYTFDVNNLDEINNDSSFVTRLIYLNTNGYSWINFYRKKNGAIEQVASFEILPTNATEPFEFNINLTNDDFH